MKTVTLNLSNKDYKKYNLEAKEMDFDHLIDKVKTVLAKEALLKCNKVSLEQGFDQLSNDEINNVIKEVRDAKGSH